MDNNDLDFRSKEFTGRVIYNFGNRKNYFDIWNKRTKFIEDQLRLLEDLDLNKLSDQELEERFKEFSKVYSNWWMLTISVELITTTIEPELGAKLKTYYPQEHPKDLNKAFAILTSPKILTFYRQEQRDLLKIIDLPEDQKGKALENHQKEYYWIYNSYLEGKVLDVNYFKDEMDKLSEGDYKNILEEIESYPDEIKRQKQEIINSINPSQDVLDLIELAEKFSAAQDDRKAINFRADHFLELFSKEFANRNGVDIMDIKFLLDSEISCQINNLLVEEIKKRRQAFVMECSDDEIKYVLGREAEELVRKFSEAKDLEESMIHGVVASAGPDYYFRGTAKIVLTIDEIGKIEPGDILVTTMTSPDFVIGMKKAGAIITDIGGILSHAAIVSRELKKTCIVGTSIATKVIKDGDVIEIHSGRGTVKIIKQGE